MLDLHLPEEFNEESHILFAMNLRQLLFLCGTDYLTIGDTQIGFRSYESPNGNWSWSLTYRQAHPTKKYANEFVEIHYIGDDTRPMYYTDMRRKYGLTYKGYTYV